MRRPKYTAETDSSQSVFMVFNNETRMVDAYADSMAEAEGKAKELNRASESDLMLAVGGSGRRRGMKRTAFVAKRHEAGSRKWLIEALDRETARIVKNRDKVCITCGAKTQLYWSHFYSRRYLNTRWNLINTNAQCRGCHKAFHNGNPFPYFNYLQKTHGADAVVELNEKLLKIVKVSDEEMRVLLADYRKR